jgi:hypothetical protein
MRRLLAVPLLLALAAPAYAGSMAMPPPCPIRPVLERHDDGTTYLNIPAGSCQWIRVQVPVDVTSPTL